MEVPQTPGPYRESAVQAADAPKAPFFVPPAPAAVRHTMQPPSAVLCACAAVAARGGGRRAVTLGGDGGRVGRGIGRGESWVQRRRARRDGSGEMTAIGGGGAALYLSPVLQRPHSDPHPRSPPPGPGPRPPALSPGRAPGCGPSGRAGRAGRGAPGRRCDGRWPCGRPPGAPWPEPPLGGRAPAPAR